jgi:ActR/RegA family two-component response regulator
MHEYRVLIVDDDISWQENFKETVESIGFLARICGSYKDANAILDRQFFHLLLVDLRLDAELRDLAGMKLVEKVTGLDEGTRTIIVSGYADATLATAALKQYGAYYLIEKAKIDIDQFTRLVQEAVLEADEAYRSKYSSAIDFLRGDQDTHAWAAGVLQAIWGEDRILGLRDLDEMRDLLNGLLEGLFPLLRHKAEKSGIVDEEKRLVSTRCWSKGLGEPILIRFGRRQLAERDREDGESRSGVARRIRTHITGDLGGIVDTLTEAEFEDFEGGDQ